MDRGWTLTWTALAAIFSIAPRAVGAEEPGGPAARTVPGEPVEITVRSSKQPEWFASTKAATGVSEKEIRDAGPGSLADAMRAKPGVSVQQTTPGQGTIYIRGLAGREVVYLVDGVRLNTAIFRSPNNAALGLLDPYSFFAVEAFRGPSSVLHGSDALGGVVAISTPLPPFADEPQVVVRAIENVTSNPWTTATRFAVRYQAPLLAAHAGATWLVADDVIPGGGLQSPVPSSYLGLERAPSAGWAPAYARAQIGTGFRRLGVDGVFRIRLGSTLELVTRAQFSDRLDLVRYDEITPRFRPDGRPARAESTLEPMSRLMTSAMLVHKPVESTLDSALLTIAFQEIRERQHRRNLDEVCTSGGKVASCQTNLRLVPTGKLSDARTRSDALSARGELRFLGDHGRRGAILGVEVIHDIIGSSAETIALATGASSETPGRYPNGARMTQGGAFAQLEAELLRGLRAHVGLRGAFFALDIPGRSGVAPALGGDAVRRSLFDLAVSLGLRWEATSGLAWVLNAGRGVRSPNVEDFAGAGSRAGGRFQVPNASLRPEHVHALDIGAKVKRGVLRADTFLFYLRFDDAIGLASTTVDGKETGDDGSRFVTSTNIQRLDFYGLESDVRLGPERVGGVYGRALMISFAERTRPGASAGERVATPASLVLGAWFFPTESLRLEVFAHARGAMRQVAREEDNRIPPNGTDAFVTLHARASYRISADVQARASIDNATNALALEYGSGYYLPGFSAMLGLEARLLR